MESKDIKERLQGMPEEEVRENLAYLLNEMDDKQQKEFLGESQ